MFSDQEFTDITLPRRIRGSDEEVYNHSVTHVEAVLHVPKTKQEPNQFSVTLRSTYMT